MVRILLLLIVLGFGKNLLAQQTATLKAVAFESKILNQKRPIYIYTPWEYNERDLVSFDVIYVLDAQNREIFDLVHAASNYIFLQKKFIVVGIASPAYEELSYFRNSDYLPKPQKVSIDKYQTDKPNAENFWKYFKDEVIPFVNKTYRTTEVNYLVGHSLSASFVLDKAIHSPFNFKGFICVSPNLAYDEMRLANDFLSIDFSKPTQKTFLYLSQSNEPKTWAKPWGDSYVKTKAFLDSTKKFGNYEIIVRDFPTYNHQSCVLPSITEGLQLLYNFIGNNPYTLNPTSSPITFTVTVPNKNDEVYIVGNQENLGNWDPSTVKLHKISDFERAIQIAVKFPIEFKITKGSWDTEGFTNQTTQSGENIVINKPAKDSIRLTINSWAE